MSPQTTKRCPNPGEGLEVALAEIRTDPSYQRGVMNAQVATIVSTFDERRFTAPIVARRPGSQAYWAIDGQQRIEALKHLGFTHVCVKLIDVRDAREEAELFVAINGQSKAVSLQDCYKACLVRQTNVAVAINSALGKYSLTAVPKNECNHDEVKCVGKMLEAWGLTGAEVSKHFDCRDPYEKEKYEFGNAALVWTIEAVSPLLTKNYKPNKVFNGNVIGALIELYRSYKGTPSLAKVQRAISKVEDPSDLRFAVTQTRMSSGGSMRSVYAMRLAYWLNQHSTRPFLEFPAEKWDLLVSSGPINGRYVDVRTDPAVVIASGTRINHGSGNGMAMLPAA